MRTFPGISDELLLVEAIRRLRTRKVMSGGRTAPEGTKFEKLLGALSETNLVPMTDLHHVLQVMLESGEILLTGYASFREAGAGQAKGSRSGIINRLHPDAKLLTHQYFTSSGTPIISKFNSERRLIYPTNSVSRWLLSIKRIYVISDGLPAAVAAMKRHRAIQPY